MNLSRLEAVNRILRGAMEHPVSTLGETTINDTLVAEQILDEVNQREQMVGFHVNTTDQTFIPDEDNDFKIVLPNNTLQVHGTNEWIDRSFAHREEDSITLLVDICPPAGDPCVATTSFEGDTDGIDLRITTLVPFEDLPPQLQFSIVDQAAVEYQMVAHGGESLNIILEKRAARSRMIARAFDMRMRPNNQFTAGRSPGPRNGRSVPRPWGRGQFWEG